jgi:hypothetical protein
MSFEETSIAQDSPLKVEVLPSTPDTPGASKQGTTTPAAKEAATGRKRKAAAPISSDDNDAAEPAAKRKRAAAATVKGAAVKKRAPKTPKILVEDIDSEKEAKVEQTKQATAPLTAAVQHKLRAVDAFLDTHTSPLPEREEGSNIAIVDGLDLLAALIILRVDYHVESSSTDVTLEDAGDMIIAELGTGKVSVDFDRTCDTEKAVQAKLAGRGIGLEDFNLIEVEIEMLVARRKQLMEEEEPDAGFRFYGGHTEDGEAGATSLSE